MKTAFKSEIKCLGSGKLKIIEVIENSFELNNSKIIDSLILNSFLSKIMVFYS